jgi:hypothetical protein
MPELPFFHDILVDISDNLSNGASDAYRQRRHTGGPVVPVSILCPASLQGVDRVKIQVADTANDAALVDGDFKDIFVDGAIVPLALTASTVLMIPEAIQTAVLGFQYMRLKCLDAANAAEEPLADITFRVQFSPGDQVTGVPGLGGIAGGAPGVVDTELPAAAALADNTATPTVPAVGAFPMVYDGATWDFLRGTAADGALVNLGTNNDVDTELPAAAALADNAATPTAPAVGAFLMVYDGAAWDMLRGTSADGVKVNLGADNDVTVTSGSITADTELPVAAALADGAANPTTPMVGSDILVWNGATWDRAKSRGTGIQNISLPGLSRVRATLNAVSPGILAAAGDYAALDVLNQSTSAGLSWSIASAARATGYGGEIRQVRLTASVAALVPRLQLFMFNAVPTILQNDNVAFLLDADDRVAFLGTIDLPALKTTGSSEISYAQVDPAFAFQCAADANLYFVVVTLDAFTNESASMTFDFHFTIAQD